MSDLRSKLLDSETLSHHSVSDFMSPYWKMISSDDDRRASFTAARVEEARGLVRQNSVKELTNQYRGSATTFMPQTDRAEQNGSIHNVEEARALVVGRTASVKELTSQYKGNSTVLPEYIFQQKIRLSQHISVTRESMRAMDTPRKHQVMQEWSSAMKKDNYKVSVAAATNFLAEYGITEHEVGKESWGEWADAIQSTAHQQEVDENVENNSGRRPRETSANEICVGSNVVSCRIPLSESREFPSPGRGLQMSPINCLTPPPAECCSSMIMNDPSVTQMTGQVTDKDSRKLAVIENDDIQLFHNSVDNKLVDFVSPVPSIRLNENIWRTVTSKSGGTEKSIITPNCPNSVSPIVRRSLVASTPVHDSNPNGFGLFAATPIVINATNDSAGTPPSTLTPICESEVGTPLKADNTILSDQLEIILESTCSSNELPASHLPSSIESKELIITEATPSEERQPIHEFIEERQRNRSFIMRFFMCFFICGASKGRQEYNKEESLIASQFTVKPETVIESNMKSDVSEINEVATPNPLQASDVIEEERLSKQLFVVDEE